METSHKILGDIITHTKYARYLDAELRRETWFEITQRNLQMHLQKFPHLAEDICDAYDLVNEGIVLPSMRSMQFAGKAIERSNSRINNCAYLPIDHPAAFQELIFLLLGGTGVGYSVLPEEVAKLPMIQAPGRPQRYIAYDSLEGWADCVKALMKAYFCGKPFPVFDLSDIRPKGARLVTAGGKAPGPEPLELALYLVNEILAKKAPGDRLTTLEVHDICCILSDAVVAGGIRRSAMIAFFDLNDEAMRNCKQGAWWEKHPWRARSNNSAIIYRPSITRQQFDLLWKSTEDSKCGEPGIYWTNELQRSMKSNPCLVGDTLVAVADGRNFVPIKDLVGTTYPVYSVKDGKVGIKQSVRTWKTRENAEVWKLVLDDGSELKATPDHQIMLRNGSYKQLKDLIPGESLMPFNLQICEVKSVEFCGYEDVYDMEVEETHNFGVITFMQDAQAVVSSGLFVHNCSEAGLRPFSFCNLSTINASAISTQREMNMAARAAALIGTLQASYTNFHYLRPIWRQTTEEDALLGVSITGLANHRFLDSIDLKEAALEVVATNERYAPLVGVNPAARCTLTKPEGTSSLRLGTSSGVHAWYSRYYLRRLRIGKDEAIHAHLQERCPRLLEDCVEKPKLQSILTIPIAAPEGAIVREEESPVDVLERVKFVQKNWVLPGHRRGVNPHSVSCTVEVGDGEWKDVGDWMWENRNDYACISAFPKDGGTYVQAPFEACTKEVYESLVRYVGEIDLSQVIETEDGTALSETVACAGGACELR